MPGIGAGLGSLGFAFILSQQSAPSLQHVLSAPQQQPASAATPETFFSGVSIEDCARFFDDGI